MIRNGVIFETLSTFIYEIGTRVFIVARLSEDISTCLEVSDCVLRNVGLHSTRIKVMHIMEVVTSCL
jgi:hypothetical protein